MHSGAALYLLQDRSVGGEDDVVLDKSHTDPPGRPQLLRSGVEPTTLQLKVPLRGSVHCTHRQLQLPVTGRPNRKYFRDKDNKLEMEKLVNGDKQFLGDGHQVVSVSTAITHSRHHQ